MHEHLSLITADAADLPAVLEKTLALFEQLRQAGAERMGYVSGIISSDGPQHVKANMRKLHEHTLYVRRENSFPIFSAADLFSPELLGRLPEMNLPHSEHKHLFMRFWRQVLSSGHITDIFMTPRWESSEGARDEYETAQKIGLRIHEVPLL